MSAADLRDAGLLLLALAGWGCRELLCLYVSKSRKRTKP